MLSNYFRTALRILSRERSYAFINILGFAIGFACCIILALYLQSELSYDKHFSQHENIYRVVGERNVNGSTSIVAPVSPVLAGYLTDDLTEVRASVRFRPTVRKLFRYEATTSYWDNIYSVDPNVFDVFSHDILYGNPQAAFEQPQSIAISESFAEHYFGSINPVGQAIRGDNTDYTVSLVFADLPENTHLRYDVLLYRNPLAERLLNAQANNKRLLAETVFGTTDYTYLLLDEGFDVSSFESMSTAVWERHFEPILGTLGIDLRYYLEPLAGVHLNSVTEQDLPRGNKFYLYAFALTALFVLIVACINYVNLATARTTKRAREVSMRKVIGAGQSQLLLQFLGESLFFTFLALGLGIVLVEVLLNFTTLSILLGKPLSLQPFIQPLPIFGLLLVVTVIGLISGLYPAFYLSNLAPLMSLKGSLKSGRGGIAIRQVLVFFQFLISVAVVSSTILMFLQMQYLQQRPLGFDRDNKITMQIYGAETIESLPAFVNELEQHSSILAASVTRVTPGNMLSTAEQEIEDNNGVMQRQTFNRTDVDANYLKTMGIELLLGRNFDPGLDPFTERGNTVVNETMVAEMGWQQPLGKEIAGRPVIGVVRDYNFHDLHQAVEPLELRLDAPYFENLSADRRAQVSRALTIAIAEDSLPATLQFIQQRWEQFDPAHPFEYELLDDLLAQFYDSDQKQMQLIGLFASLCIFIACLGLYGLSAFTTEQRSREIGIRKVLGASASQLIVMLFRNILVLVVFAGLLSSVVSYWTISRWLESFAYRIDISAGTFLLATVLCVAIAFVTMATQSWKTSQSNPVEALRYE